MITTHRQDHPRRLQFLISVLPPVNGAFTTVEAPDTQNRDQRHRYEQFPPFGVGTDASHDNDPNTECITLIIFDADGRS
jgi:hypothetical protein